jgi:hypothetical protein
LTEKLGRENSNNIIDVITSWELFLMQDKIPYKVIYDNDLESGIDDEFDILILPSVDFISNDEMEGLQKFLGNGKSIICSGSKLFFQQNNLNEYQNLETLFGLRNIESVSLESMSYLHSLLPNQLNHFMLDDELILQISNKNQALFGEEVDNKMNSYGYLFTENLPNSKRSSIIYGTIGGCRFLWTGFDLNDVIGGSEDLLAYKNLISNTIKWMDYQPDAYISNFIDSLTAPVIVTLQYNNALELELIDVLQKNNIRPNLIVNPDQKVSKEILNKFSSDEIILELSGSNTLSFNIINGLVDNFNRNNEISLSSILVEKQFLENGDLSLFNSIGINKILYNEHVPGLPRFLNKDLWLIPFVKSDALPSSRNVVNFLNYNPKINCDDDPEDELLRKMNYVKSQQYNFTSLSSLEKWWNRRKKIISEIRNVSDNEVELWLTNKNSVAIDGLNVFLNYAKKIDKETLSISLNSSLLEYYFEDASSSIKIKLDNILPNSLNKIKINYNVE